MEKINALINEIKNPANSISKKAALYDEASALIKSTELSASAEKKLGKALDKSLDYIR